MDWKGFILDQGNIAAWNFPSLLDPQQDQDFGGRAGVI